MITATDRKPATPYAVWREDAYTSGAEAARYWRGHAPAMDVEPLARAHCRMAGIPAQLEEEIGIHYVRGWYSVVRNEVQR